ncbi:MAG TPA: SGNH/GDSL hydrolase family protein [Sphingomicrobium sp.]|nr:SGNH/GDSL hydrolase family protein [Sphingomicrobium sp.]
MAYSGVYVFGDSLIDAGNALKLAQFYGNLTFSDLPDGAPAASDGYFQGRFTDGYTFADLISNKAIGKPTTTIFPYGFEWNGVPIAPWASDPSGNNLNFGYGGAQVRQGGEAVPDLDGQTDTFRDAVDGDAPPGALYLVTMGGNDVRSLAKVDEPAALPAEAYAALDEVVQQLIHELGQLIEDGARHFLITGIPDVGMIPAYDDDGIEGLSAAEQERADAATLYSIYLDTLVRTELVDALEAMGATVTYVPMMDYQEGGVTVTGGLNAILPTLEALHGLAPGTLKTDLLAHREVVFFDQVHPTAQVHALFGSFAHAMLTKSDWIEILPVAKADRDFSLTGSIAFAGEVDQLVIAAVAGTTYRFDLLGMSSLGVAGSLGDPTLSVLSGGVTLVSDADSGAGFDATVTFTAANSANHALSLSAAGSLTGTYQLVGAVVGGAAMEVGNSYVVTSASTIVIEGAGGAGRDTVQSSVSYALAPFSEIEQLTTTNARGKSAINLTGNDFSQTIIGNAGANVIEGKGGADTMTGGGGNDVFVLSRAAVENTGLANIDIITDYSKGDIVDVSQLLSVGAGVNIATGGFLRVTSSGLIQVDVNGNADQWVTLSTINGNGAVTIRYLSGGALTTTSVSRTAVQTSASTMVTSSALAASGVAMLGVDSSGEHDVAHAPAIIRDFGGERGVGSLAADAWSVMPALSALEGHGQFGGDLAGPSLSLDQPSLSIQGFEAFGPLPMPAVSALLLPTEAAMADFATVRPAIAMPAVGPIEAGLTIASDSAGPGAELGLSLVDSLDAPGGATVDGLLDLLVPAGGSQFAMLGASPGSDGWQMAQMPVIAGFDPLAAPVETALLAG